MKVIDLRSDTVTTPTAAMRRAMAAAKVGDDVYGEDPTVGKLEEMAAGLLNKESALFVPTGTMSNLLALLTHCSRGDEYIAGQEAHCYRYEGGGAAMVGGIQPQPLDFEKDGTLDLVKVADAVKPDDPHCARTRLLCLENTQAGKVLPLSYLENAARVCREKGLSLHLDGARFFNATVKLGIAPDKASSHFDSISVCLSKSLGAPAGSLLCGSGEFIREARRWRKVLGGGMRQSGILAAAGIVALRDHVSLLAQDHFHASLLAEGLASIEELAVDPASVQTNMVFLSPDTETALNLTLFLGQRGIRVAGRGSLRLVTHLDVGEKEIGAVVRAVHLFFSRKNTFHAREKKRKIHARKQ